MFKSLNVNSLHYLHFGRMVATHVMDLQEINRMDKRETRNWNPDTFDNLYSVGMNFTSISVLADSCMRREDT